MELLVFLFVFFDVVDDALPRQSQQEGCRVDDRVDTTGTLDHPVEDMIIFLLGPMVELSEPLVPRVELTQPLIFLLGPVMELFTILSSWLGSSISNLSFVSKPIKYMNINMGLMIINELHYMCLLVLLVSMHRQ